ncbi:hypothetical protein [Sulfurimonas sp. HSL-1716]|uniref:hypothetical protein n=1 Tax=Hydrocurvibacter sulfurireducens TaxID=3131937 RepID=UPI0031F7E086
MIFFTVLFLVFLYFKIARVHKKEELMNTAMLVQHLLVGLSAVSLLYYGILFVKWYFFMLLVVLFVIVASLAVTTVQLGIFVDGKPMFGLSKTYKYLPILTIAILLFSTVLWGFETGVI